MTAPAEPYAYDPQSCLTDSVAPTVEWNNADFTFPEVTGDAGSHPTIAAGTGTEPTTIQVKTLNQGDGETVACGAGVNVHYTLALWDGTEMESSYNAQSSTAFSLNEVISGWKYGLVNAHVGDRLEMVIPAEYAYGSAGSGNVPANATLTFVVEVLGTVDANNPNTLIDATISSDWASQLPAGVTINGELGSDSTITFAEGATAPTEVQTIVIATGTGPEITSTDYVYYHAAGSAFGATDFDSTRTTGAQSSSAGNEYFVGKTVGTRMVMFFPATSATSSQSAQNAQVLVIDVMGVLSPQ